VDAAGKQASVHGGLSCGDCHDDIHDYPHPARPKKVACADCHDDAVKAVAASAHAGFGATACTECHGAPHAVRGARGAAGTLCEACHEDAVKEYRGSIHASRSADGASCRACHGPAHEVLGASQPKSRVAKQSLPETCAACHANPDFLAKHRVDLARPIESYRLSVHGRAVARGNPKAASCSDCHGNHAILPARDPRSPINHWRVAAPCGHCHGEIQRSYTASIHGQAVARGVRESPVCTDCHGEHAILAPSEPESLVSPARVSSATCERCHGDERLAAKYNLPRDKVPTFEASFHGLALRAGSQTVANCASCHGVHNILPSSDPRSTINAANLARTCGACHPGAGARFSIGPVHVRPASAVEHPVVRWIRLSYVFLILPFTLGFMALHNMIDFLAKLARNVPSERSGEEVPRMGLHFRIAHALVVLSFPTLIVTGFALKFPDAWWARPFLAFEGSFDFRGLVHRIAAVILIAAFLYHAVHLAISAGARRLLVLAWPRWQDLRDLVAMLRHNLGRKVARPRFGALSYAEKAEYWAFMWGTLVMAASGLILWFNNLTLTYLPKWVSDAATALHYYEALLATFAIAIWHGYMVIFDPDVYPMDRSWLTGRASADHLRHSRPDYYREIAGDRDEEA
jgi:cytochrome b subunit of formate dehydrogenase